IKNVGQIVDTVEVLDDKNNVLSKVKMKKNTVNLTMTRQDLMNVIKSYVPDTAIFTNHFVTHIDNGDLKVTLHFSEQPQEAFDLCIGAAGLDAKASNTVAISRKIAMQGDTGLRGLGGDIGTQHTHVAKEDWSPKSRGVVVTLINSLAYL